jgi:hypothetical protein
LYENVNNKTKIKKKKRKYCTKLIGLLERVKETMHEKQLFLAHISFYLLLLLTFLGLFFSHL